jgi:hypothetical protein
MFESVFDKGTRQDLKGCFMGPIGGPGAAREQWRGDTRGGGCDVSAI